MRAKIVEGACVICLCGHEDALVALLCTAEGLRELTYEMAPDTPKQRVDVDLRNNSDLRRPGKRHLGAALPHRTLKLRTRLRWLVYLQRALLQSRQTSAFPHPSMTCS